MPSPSIPLGVLAAAALSAQSIGAPWFGANDVASVFYVSKSENKNQVHFGVHLAADCTFEGATPAFSYWEIREGAAHREALLPREEPAYGIASQSIASGALRVTLRALPHRTIVVYASRGEHGCTATAAISLSGATARLDHVFVQLAWPFGVSHLSIVGRTDLGAWVEERVSP